MSNYVEKVRKELLKEIKVNDSLLNLYSLLVLTKGENTTLKDIHDAWSLDTNRFFSEHKSIIPFEELTKEVQDKDIEYLEAAKKVARNLNK